jgi:hypothetical protein
MKSRNLFTSLLPHGALAGTAALAAGLALASSAFTAAPAQAFSLSISPQYGSTENTGATAKLDFTFADTTGGVTLNLGIENTTDGTAGLGATAATLVGVALDLPSIVSNFTYNSGSSAFTQEFFNVSIPGLNSNNTFDVGIRSAGSGNFVGGNPQQGLTAGQSTNVSFLLTGANLTAAGAESAFFSGFQGGSLSAAGRFQQVNAGGGSDKVLAGGVTGGGNTAAVPEPSTLAGLALCGALATRLRSRKVQQNA